MLSIKTTETESEETGLRFEDINIPGIYRRVDQSRTFRIKYVYAKDYDAVCHIYMTAAGKMGVWTDRDSARRFRLVNDTITLISSGGVQL